MIRDNAAGISYNDFPRAFRPAAIPPDRSGLSEFGMGMKSAACWFAPTWRVRTSALGEPIERTVYFDIARIVHDELEEIEVQSRPVAAETHYTEITLETLHTPLKGRTIGKVKDHLTSIYRVFLREGELQLLFNREPLHYVKPRILRAPPYRHTEEPRQDWCKDIDFDFGQGQRVRGFAALREVASTSTAGFALFRRKRLIEGSGDETYRPTVIFGRPNSYTYQRLFGELELEGFEVSHTKDGFRWDEHEEVFLDILKQELDKPPICLLQQAEGYRARPKKGDLRKSAEVAVARTGDAVVHEAPEVLQEQLDRAPDPEPPPSSLLPIALASRRELDVELAGFRWQVVLELSADEGISDWLAIFEEPDPGQLGSSGYARRVGLRLALLHPFMQRFAGTDLEIIEPLLRVAAALGLGEVTARMSGVADASTVRLNVNELLREAFAKPAGEGT